MPEKVIFCPNCKTHRVEYVSRGSLVILSFFFIAAGIMLAVVLSLYNALSAFVFWLAVVIVLAGLFLLAMVLTGSIKPRYFCDKCKKTWNL